MSQEGTVHGREAVRAMWERWEADWEDLRFVAEEFLDAGDHVVLPLHYLFGAIPLVGPD